MDERTRRADQLGRLSRKRFPTATDGRDLPVDDARREARRAADWAAADAARRRLRKHGIVPIEPDERIAAMLAPDEQLIAFRAAIPLDRRHPCSGGDAGIRGDLYVTTRRIVHLGRVPVAFDLDDINEAAVAGDSLLLMIGSNLGVSLLVHDPRLLRVEVAAARAARRRR